MPSHDEYNQNDPNLGHHASTRVVFRLIFFIYFGEAREGYASLATDKPTSIDVWIVAARCAVDQFSFSKLVHLIVLLLNFLTVFKKTFFLI